MNKEEILDQIDRETIPALMSKEEALEFIADIVDDLQIRYEALEMEIEDQ